ncbi:MAG: cyclase family protein, partial [Patescibacteria group bacterium]
MDIHIGTHVEGPLHSFPGAASVDEIPLEIFMGRALVVDLPSINIITAGDLEKLNLPEGVERLLLRTKNSEFWRNFRQAFWEDFVGLAADAAQWIADHKIKLIGLDYLSIANFKQGDAVHKTLLKNGVFILEGLNLLMAPAGEYELVC